MADQRELIVIFGINSRQGSAVARYLVGQPNFRICGITRDVFCTASQAWADLDVHLFQIKELHKETYAVEQVVKGASAIFVVTDYFYHYLNDHSTVSLASVWKTDVHGFAASREYLDGAAIADAAEKEVVETIVKNIPGPIFVLSCMTYGDEGSVESWDMIPSGLQQFRAKSQMAEYINAYCPDLATRTRLLNPALRMEDWTDFLQRKHDGTYTFGTTLPAKADLPWTHFADDTGPLFWLCCQRHGGLNLAAVSDIKSGVQICEFVQKATGKPCKYVQYSEQALVQLLGPARGQVMVDMLVHLAEKKYYQDAKIALSHHLLIGEPADLYQLTSLEEYVTVGLPDFVKEKGWADGLFQGEGWEWSENRRSALSLLSLQRELVDKTFDECAKEARRRNAQAEKSSKAVAAAAFPQRPVMEPFTPPRTKPDGIEVQTGESSKTVILEMQPPSHPRRTNSPDRNALQSTPDCDKPIPSIETDHLHGNPSSQPLDAATPDQAMRPPVQPSSRPVASSEIVHLRSNASSPLSSAPELGPTPPWTAAHSQGLETSALLSDTDIRGRNQVSSELSSVPPSVILGPGPAAQSQQQNAYVQLANFDVRGQDQGQASEQPPNEAEPGPSIQEARGQHQEHNVPVQPSDLNTKDQNQPHPTVKPATSNPEQRQEHTAPVQPPDINMKDQNQTSSQPSHAVEPDTATPSARDHHHHQEPNAPAPPSAVDAKDQAQGQDSSQPQPARADSLDTVKRREEWMTIIL